MAPGSREAGRKRYQRTISELVTGLMQVAPMFADLPELELPRCLQSWRCLVAAVIFAVAAAPPWVTSRAASESELRASDLLADCDSMEAAAFLYCVAYLEGVSDAIQGLKSVGHDVGVCFPEDVTIGQSALAVREWIRKNPEYHDLRPVEAVLPALRATFPCG